SSQACARFSWFVASLGGRGRNGAAVARREFPKPTIWVSPSRVVALGGNITIRCEGLYLDLEFFLYKAGDPNLQVWTVPAGKVAEFPIPSVGQEDGGSYTCEYHSITDQNRWSCLSDPVEIIVAGEGRSWLSFPAPSATPSQILRGSLHRWDAQSLALPWGQQRGRLAGELAQSPTSRWWCCAQNRGVLPRILPALPTRPHSPPRAGERTQESWLPALPTEKPGSEWTLETGLACHVLGSRALGPQGLGLLQPSYPKPSISLLRPSWGVSLGGTIIFRCQGQRLGKRFVLNKERRHFPPVDSIGFGAEFLISNVRREDGGNYSCSYQSQLEPFALSDPSDPVELVVRGEGPVPGRCSGTAPHKGKKLTRLHLLGLSLEHSASSAPPCASHSEPTQVGSWGSH
uniref:Ig-like domain-containing protein n=1 Tax=Chelonoidis abingdonii TaxID=106734 RepID=A0A8C0GC59_CHEAB